MNIINLSLQLSNKLSKNSLLQYWSTVFGAALLVAGTCLGAGMLGLPVVTSAAGLCASLVIFLIIWLVMTFTALVLLEVSLLLPGETNLISMAQATIGIGGKYIAWITYLLFLYSVMAAYTAGGTTIVAQIMQVQITDFPWLLLVTGGFVLPFMVMIYFGAKIVDYFNRVVVFGLFISFMLICMAVIKHTNYQVMLLGDIKYVTFTLPLIVTAFGYHLLIPTLKTYLHENVVKLRLAIIIGSLIPLGIYIIWEIIILGLIPTWGKAGLVHMIHANGNPGDLVILALQKHHAIIATIVAVFSFSALTTSVIGVGLGIFDFFADGLNIKKTTLGKMWLLLLTFGPPALYTMIYPRGFLLALNYAGVFAAILLIIYPAIMAWYGRYVVQVPTKYRVKGGKKSLVFAIIFGGLVILAEILSQFDMLPIPKN